MDAAVVLAAERGFAKTRVSDIVGHVGVGQGVFYWYFDSKDALFGEILEDTTLRMRIFQGAYIADEPDPVRRIAKGIVASFDFIVHNAHVFALLDHASAKARLRRRRIEPTRETNEDTIRHLNEAVANGTVRDSDPAYMARAITGVVDRLARDYFAGGRRDLDNSIQETIDFCLGGILGARTLKVAELRDEVDVNETLERVRDQVGVTRDGAAPPPGRR